MRITKNNNITQKSLWILKGFVLGLTCLIPGVSAGTLALIMGIYERIIFSLIHLTTLSKETRGSMVFLLCLAIGALLSFVLLTKGLSLLLSFFPLQIYSFFMGLIIASLPRLLTLTDKTKQSFLLIAATAIGFFVFLQIIPPSNPLLSKDSFFWLFTSGFLAVFSSLLPGLSGSTVLLLLSTYQPLLKYLSEWVKEPLLIFLTGGVLGLICSLYFVRFFLKKRENLFFCLIIGLIIASLPEILPWKQEYYTDIKATAINIIAFTGIGAFLFFIIEKYFLKKQPASEKGSGF